MGMDIWGRNPACEAGQFFHCSMWEWRPLAELLVALCPAETAACEYWQSSDGDGLDADGSARLAARLDELLRRGAVKAWCDGFKARLAIAEGKTCPRCSGIRFLPNGRDTCGVCRGQGALIYQEFDAPDEQDVRQLVGFLKNCGGFTLD